MRSMKKLEASETDADEDLDDDEDWWAEYTEAFTQIEVVVEEDIHECPLVRILYPILLVGVVKLAWFELLISEIKFFNMDMMYKTSIADAGILINQSPQEEYRKSASSQKDV